MIVEQELLSVPESETDKLRRLLRTAEEGCRVESEEDDDHHCIICWGATENGLEHGYIEHGINCPFRMFNR